MAGTVSFSGLGGAGEINIHYRAPDGFASGTVHAVRQSDSTELTQAASDGAQTITGITEGVWHIYVTTDAAEVSNILTVRYDGVGSYGSDALKLKWRRNQSDPWHEKEFGGETELIRWPVNIQGRSLQWKVETFAPNRRATIRNIQMVARVKSTEASNNVSD